MRFHLGQDIITAKLQSKQLPAIICIMKTSLQVVSVLSEKRFLIIYS